MSVSVHVLRRMCVCVCGGEIRCVINTHTHTWLGVIISNITFDYF